jgi:hypothetical protein
MSKVMDKMFDKVMEKFIDRVDSTIIRLSETYMKELTEIKQLIALMIKEQRKTNKLLEKRR